MIIRIRYFNFENTRQARNSINFYKYSYKIICNKNRKVNKKVKRGTICLATTTNDNKYYVK